MKYNREVGYVDWRTEELMSYVGPGLILTRVMPNGRIQVHNGTCNVAVRRRSRTESLVREASYLWRENDSEEALQEACGCW